MLHADLGVPTSSQDFEKWMGNVDTGSTAAGMPMFVPVDINQDADMYTFTADLPGVSKADTKVSAFGSTSSETSHTLRCHNRHGRFAVLSHRVSARMHKLLLEMSGSVVHMYVMGFEAASAPCRRAACSEGILPWLLLTLLSSLSLQVQANKDDRMLTISGTRAAPEMSEDQKQRRRRTERRFGKFRRSFQVCH